MKQNAVKAGNKAIVMLDEIIELLDKKEKLLREQANVVAQQRKISIAKKRQLQSELEKARN